MKQVVKDYLERGMARRAPDRHGSDCRSSERDGGITRAYRRECGDFFIGVRAIGERRGGAPLCSTAASSVRSCGGQLFEPKSREGKPRAAYKRAAA